MKTDSRIRPYLASVERAASALPARRREELIEDLAEHIGVNLIERPGQLVAILAELGDPEEIAAIACKRTRWMPTTPGTATRGWPSERSRSAPHPHG
ncbi:HAAS signaling domain-containing protein [Streptantibioticus silvisoli]|uniref:HAAS signaling domain-containing protein n=1 Tax=Streptantibioticus silvisoli TaxID=2705255 RepID=UPI0035588048